MTNTLGDTVATYPKRGRAACVCREALILIAATACFTPSPLVAIDIEIQLDHNTSENPPWDPNGDFLALTAAAAELIWEDLFPGPGTYNIGIEWDDDIGGLGLWSPSPITNGTIEINPNPNSPWWYDPTPLDHSEFNFTGTGTSMNNFAGQTLFRDLTTPEQAGWFDGNVPDLLEVGYRGVAQAGSLASGRFDLLSTVVHEVGHAIGINFEGDDEFDIYSDHLLLATPFPVVQVEADSLSGHLALRSALMCDGCGALSLRRLPSAVDVLVIAHDEAMFSVDLKRKDFGRISGSWNTASNWLGYRVPDADDQVFVRQPQAGSPATVNLSANAGVLDLTIAEGAKVDTVAFDLISTGQLTVTDLGSNLFIRSGSELRANGVLITLSAEIETSGGELNVNRFMITPGGQFEGTGGANAIFVNQSLTNDGAIRANGGSLLNFYGSGVAPFNLDGLSENGVLDARNGSIDFVTGWLTDAFHGTMLIGDGRYIDTAGPWTISGDLEMDGGATPATAAELRAQAFVTFLGASVQVAGFTSMNAPTYWVASSIELDDGAELELGDDENHPVDYETSTFEGLGTLVQNGNATVAANRTVTIDVADFDWDGQASTVSDTSVYGTMDLTGERITDAHNGVILIYGGIVNVETAPWTMAGRLDLRNAGALMGTARVTLTGDLVATGGDNRVASPLTLASGGSVDVGFGGTAEVEFDGPTTYSGGSYAGSGRIGQTGPATITASTTVGAFNSFLVLAPGAYKPLHVQEYDWDGDAGGSAQTTINPGVAFTINAVQIDGSAADGYDGTVNVNGGALVVNTGVRTPIVPPGGGTPGQVIPAGPSALPWRLDGTMNLTESGDGTPAVVTTGLGSPMLIYGTVNANVGASSIAIATLVIGTINVRNGATLTASGFTASGGSIDVDGTLRLSGAALQPATNMRIFGYLELAANTTIQGGTYTGVGFIRQMGNATIANTTTFDVSAEFIAGGTTTIAANQELRLDRAATVAAGATIDGPGTVRNLAGSPLAIVDGGQVDAPLINEGTLRLGTLPVIADPLVEAYTQTSTGDLQIQIGSANGVSDRLRVTGAASLDGFLGVARANQLVTPAPTDVFTILTANSISGKFANAPGGATRFLTSFGSFQVNYLPTSVVLLNFVPGVPGDFNNDGRVDAADYVVWRNGLGTIYTQNDYNIWRSHFGQTAGSGSASSANATVPEPTTLVVLIVAAVGIRLRRRSVA